MNASNTLASSTKRLSRLATLSAGAALAATALLATSTTASADGWWRSTYVVESLEVSNLRDFATDEFRAGAAILVRDYNNNVVDVTLSATDLTPGHAYSIWIAVFNNPWFCSDLCGVDDLPGANPDADPRIKPSVFYGGGFVADGTGGVNTALKIVPGRTTRQLFGGTENFGLQRLFGTEIHVVVRTHGEPLLGQIATQIGTANDACNPACSNILFSAHPPRD